MVGKNNYDEVRSILERILEDVGGKGYLSFVLEANKIEICEVIHAYRSKSLGIRIEFTDTSGRKKLLIIRFVQQESFAVNCIAITLWLELYPRPFVSLMWYKRLIFNMYTEIKSKVEVLIMSHTGEINTSCIKELVETIEEISRRCFI